MTRKFSSTLSVVVGALLAAGLSVASADAALTLPTALTVTDMESVASLIIVAAAAIWVMRRVISFFGK
jgi:hypothetical protein